MHGKQENKDDLFWRMEPSHFLDFLTSARIEHLITLGDQRIFTLPIQDGEGVKLPNKNRKVHFSKKTRTLTISIPSDHVPSVQVSANPATYKCFRRVFINISPAFDHVKPLIDEMVENSDREIFSDLITAINHVYGQDYCQRCRTFYECIFEHIEENGKTTLNDEMRSRIYISTKIGSLAVYMPNFEAVEKNSLIQNISKTLSMVNEHSQLHTASGIVDKFNRLSVADSLASFMGASVTYLKARGHIVSIDKDRFQVAEQRPMESLYHDHLKSAQMLAYNIDYVDRPQSIRVLSKAGNQYMTMVYPKDSLFEVPVTRAFSGANYTRSIKKIDTAIAELDDFFAIARKKWKNKLFYLAKNKLSADLRVESEGRLLSKAIYPTIKYLGAFVTPLGVAWATKDIAERYYEQKITFID